eukprot:TRINITY_DN14182_c0_g1_i1.p1 TRINITY_DN14182_c0_g1~~TRINITY_DN14182_c0_g1_i1.p1  ORF type:complete len:427 (+),score=75.35 TRINITY_DN14182_c0_g1_i1:68-1348(+)
MSDYDAEEELYACILDDVVDLDLAGSDKWDESTIKECIKEGGESQVFRSMVMQLFEELIGITLDTRKALGFYKSIAAGFRSAKIETNLNLKYLHASETDRRYLVEYLIAETKTNRMLEAKLLSDAGEDVVVFDTNDVDKNIQFMLKTLCQVFNYQKTIGVVILKKLELEFQDKLKSMIKLDKTHMEKCISRDELTEEQLSTVRAVHQFLLTSFAKRREVAISRAATTIRSFQWSDKPGVDLFRLKNKSDALLTQLAKKPAVSMDSLFSATRLSLYTACFVPISAKVKTQFLFAPHKNYKIGTVKDRDGRVNTFNTAERVANDIERVNRELHKGRKGGGKGKGGGGDGGKGKGGGGYHNNNNNNNYHNNRPQGYQNQGNRDRTGKGSKKGKNKGGNKGFSHASQNNPHGGASFNRGTQEENMYYSGR